MWTNPQIKNHNNSHEFRLTRPRTQQKELEHTYLKFLTPSVEKIVNLNGLRQVYEPRNVNVLFSQYGS